MDGLSGVPPNIGETVAKEMLIQALIELTLPREGGAETKKEEKKDADHGYGHCYYGDIDEDG